MTKLSYIIGRDKTDDDLYLIVDDLKQTVRFLYNIQESNIKFYNNASTSVYEIFRNPFYKIEYGKPLL